MPDKLNPETKIHETKKFLLLSKNIMFWLLNQSIMFLESYQQIPDNQDPRD